MEKTLTELCAELNNYFWRAKKHGNYTIAGGSIDLSGFLQDGQYFRIVGSVFNDGVHKYPASDLTDEEFIGDVWSMAVPAAVIDLAADIKAWNAKYAGVNSPALSPFQSETFNNYSYTKASGSAGSAGGVDKSATWQGAFAARMSKWRRLRGLQ